MTADPVQRLGAVLVRKTSNRGVATSNHAARTRPCPRFAPVGVLMPTLIHCRRDGNRKTAARRSFCLCLKIKRGTEKKSAIMLQCMSLLLAPNRRPAMSAIGPVSRANPTCH